MQSSVRNPPATPAASKRRCSFDDPYDLPTCKVRRNYVCKDCHYGTTNPREFLYHQRDFHGQKGAIHECPFCIYASPHTHKLNRHISVVHSVHRSAPQPHATTVRPLPPPPLLLQHSAAPPGINLPPELEVILVEEENGGGGSGTPPRKTVRPLLMEPSISVLPIPPLPTLVTRPRSQQPAAPAKKALPSATPSRPPPPTVTTTLLKSALTAQPPREFSCSLCSFRSKSRILVQRHEKVSHLKKKFFRCTKCNYVTNVRSRYTKHVRYHSMPYVKCEMCDFSTPYKWNLDRHRRHHLQDGCGAGGPEGGPFRCGRCSYAGNSAQSLNMHALNHHGGRPRPRRRIENNEEEEEEVDGGRSGSEGWADDAPSGGSDDGGTDCDFDGGENQSDAQDLEEKRENGVDGESMHGVDEAADGTDAPENGDKPSGGVGAEPGVYSCTECGDGFSTVALLDRHMYECHDIENPRIPPRRKLPGRSLADPSAGKPGVRCDICSYEAKWVSEMVKHRRVHSQEKPFTCPHCDFRSRWKGDMTRHVARYHSGAAAPPPSSEDQAGDKEENEEEFEDPGPLVTDNIECLMDQSMKVGGEDELCLWGPEAQEGDQDIPLDLSLAVGDEDEDGSPFEEGEDDGGGSGSSPAPSGAKAGARKKYQCPHCTYLTSTPSRFHMHIVAHLNPKPFMCSECGYRSNWQWDITKHAKMKAIRDPGHHDATIVLVNEYGTANYDRYDQYAVYDAEGGAAVSKAHQDRVLRNRSEEGLQRASGPVLPAAAAAAAQKITYKCKHCDFKSPVKKTVMRHMVVHSDSKNARFWCGVCGQPSNWKHVILRHCHHVHGTSGPILLKDSSPASPPRAEEFRKATSVISSDEGIVQDEGGAEEPQQPRKGGDDVVSNGADENDRLQKCSICPYKCQKVFDLRIHSYLHRPREGATFKCMFCPFYVSLKRSWLNHMKLHVDKPQDYSKLLQEITDRPDAGGGAPLPGQRSSQEPVAAQGGGGGGDDLEPAETAESPEGVPRVWVNRGGAFLKMFKCRHCPHVSKKRAVIVAHEIMHRRRKMGAGKASYKCPHCNYTSKNAGVLTSHQKVHQEVSAVHSYVDAGDGPQPSMSAVTTMEDGRLKIKISKSPGDGGGFQAYPVPARRSGRPVKVYHGCTECPAKFDKLEQMLSHRGFHSANLPYRCGQCTYTARHRPHLHKHERVHTAEYQNAFPRSAPPAAAGSEAATGGDERDPSLGPATSLPKGGDRKHQCRMCPAVFLKYSTLIYHMHLHNNNGKFKCDQCTYSVSNIGNLARHSKVHCPGGGGAAAAGAENAPLARRPKSRYACQLCPATFEKRMRFNVHMTLHGSQFRFRCNRCDYAVKFAAILTRHKSLHDAAEARRGHEAVAALMATSSLSPLAAAAASSSSSASGMDQASAGLSAVAFSRNRILLEEASRGDEGGGGGGGLTLAERQQVMLQLLQERAAGDAAAQEGEPAADPRKLFCCDRCPYVHQRKDAVQSHLKRHLPTGRESSRCPYCDYATSIHSFLREHTKLHFKPFRNHQPEGFIRWEDFQVCERSAVDGEERTVVFEHRVDADELGGGGTVPQLPFVPFAIDEPRTTVRQLLSELVWQVEVLELKERHRRDSGRKEPTAAAAVEGAAASHGEQPPPSAAAELADGYEPAELDARTTGCGALSERAAAEGGGAAAGVDDASADDDGAKDDFPPNSRYRTVREVDIFRRMVGCHSPAELLLKRRQGAGVCDADDAEREYMEVALCLGCSS